MVLHYTLAAHQSTLHFRQKLSTFTISRIRLKQTIIYKSSNKSSPKYYLCLSKTNLLQLRTVVLTAKNPIRLAMLKCRYPASELKITIFTHRLPNSNNLIALLHSAYQLHRKTAIATYVSCSVTFTSIHRILLMFLSLSRKIRTLSDFF